MSAIDQEVQSDAALGAQLLALARYAIARELGLPGRPPRAIHPRLAERGATFVTLTEDGELRGCIGSLNPRRALAEDVRENALGAAFRDTRFTPLNAREWPRVRVEVSLLSTADFLEDVSSEARVIEQLRPGIDGVILFNGCRQATFLPQVWEQLPRPRDFLAALKRKAGLPEDFWGPRIMVATYQVAKWKEPEPTA